MTREEAIDILKHDISADKQGIEYCHDEIGIEALEMAIKALKQEPIYYPPCIDCNKKMDEIRHAYDKLKEQEPSGDVISRQAVIDACEQSINILEAVDRIMDLPSVEQEPKTGHWSNVGICGYKCSECGKIQYADDVNELNYCCTCGARMESEDKE